MPKKTERGAEATSHVNNTKTCGTAQDITTVHDMVDTLLKEHPATRSSDRALITAVYDEYYGILNEPFWQVMARNDLPSFETITRCRRKIQQDDESLRGTQAVERQRIYRQVDFLEYADM